MRKVQVMLALTLVVFGSMSLAQSQNQNLKDSTDYSEFYSIVHKKIIAHDSMLALIRTEESMNKRYETPQWYSFKYSKRKYKKDSLYRSIIDLYVNKYYVLPFKMNKGLKKNYRKNNTNFSYFDIREIVSKNDKISIKFYLKGYFGKTGKTIGARTVAISPKMDKYNKPYIVEIDKEVIEALNSFTSKQYIEIFSAKQYLEQSLPFPKEIEKNLIYFLKAFAYFRISDYFLYNAHYKQKGEIFLEYMQVF